MQKNVTRKSVHSLEEVFLQTQANPKVYQRFAGNRIILNSHRIKNFRYHGTHCVVCGLRALYFAKERHKGNDHYHINLYGVVGETEILFTQDHIKPKSKGGRNCVHNLQPMCELCNRRKNNEWNIKQRWALFKTYVSHWVRKDKFACQCRWMDIIVDMLT